MSLWDAVTSFISSDTPILGSLISAGGAVASAAISSSANTRAAEIANQGATRQSDAIVAGNRQAQQRFDTIQDQTAPGVSHLRTTALSSPGQLTPDQQFQLDEARRSSLTALNASDLRGSGRATTAVLKDVESNFRNTAIGQNRQRKDNAANALANQNFGAQTAGANLDAQQGRDVGAAQATTGNTNADLVTSNARLSGQALADVSSIISDATKKRESRFGESEARREAEEEEVL